MKTPTPATVAPLPELRTAPSKSAHTTSQMETVWHHLDQLCPDEGDLLTVAAESVEAVVKALRDSKAVHPDVMARLLDSAARTIREAHQHIGRAIVELGDLTN